MLSKRWASAAAVAVTRTLHVGRQRSPIHRFQPHDEAQDLALPGERITVHAGDVQHAKPAHFEKVLQQRWATAFERTRCQAGEFRSVVGDQDVPAGDQLECNLALADAGVAGDQDSGAVDVHHHPVDDLPRGQFAGQQIAQLLAQLDER